MVKTQTESKISWFHLQIPSNRNTWKCWWLALVPEIRKARSQLYSSFGAQRKTANVITKKLVHGSTQYLMHTQYMTNTALLR